MGQDIQRVWFGSGEKKGVYSGVLWAEMSYLDGISPKGGKYGLVSTPSLDQGGKLPLPWAFV